MSTIINKILYSCSNDCKIQGCPTHVAELTYQSTSDAYSFNNGKGHIINFERNELESFIKLLKQLNRIDSININNL